MGSLVAWSVFIWVPVKSEGGVSLDRANHGEITKWGSLKEGDSSDIYAPT